MCWTEPLSQLQTNAYFPDSYNVRPDPIAVSLDSGELISSWLTLYSLDFTMGSIRLPYPPDIPSYMKRGYLLHIARDVQHSHRSIIYQHISHAPHE